jgi:hypothetical protein
MFPLPSVTTHPSHISHGSPLTSGTRDPLCSMSWQAVEKLNNLQKTQLDSILHNFPSPVAGYSKRLVRRPQAFWRAEDTREYVSTIKGRPACARAQRSASAGRREAAPAKAGNATGGPFQHPARLGRRYRTPDFSPCDQQVFVFFTLTEITVTRTPIACPWRVLSPGNAMHDYFSPFPENGSCRSLFVHEADISRKKTANISVSLLDFSKIVTFSPIKARPEHLPYVES